jgi:uncharacterized protein (TIRG00374 family)
LFFTRPTIKDIFSDNFAPNVALFTLFLFIALVTLSQWLIHARKTRKSILSLNKEWKRLFRHLTDRKHRFISLTITAFLILLGNVSILVLCADALEIHISYVDAVVALSAGVFVGGLLPTPGGLGGVEAGTVSTLVLLGFDGAEATSIALLFRTITYWQPLIPGTLSYLYLRERKLI